MSEIVEKIDQALRRQYFNDAKLDFPNLAKAAIAALADGLDERALEIACKEGSGTWHNMTGKDSLNEAIASAIRSYLTSLKEAI